MIWTILGFSVGIVAFFCITGAETLVGKPMFELNRALIAGAFAIVGVVAWFVGRYLGSRKSGAESETEETAAAKRFILFDLRYWGPMFVVLGIITLFIRPLKQETTEVVAQAPPAPVKTAAVVVAVEPKVAPKPQAPVEFPVLKMQGVIYRSERPFAIINGRSYAVGDHVGEVLVKAIDRTSVLLELSGELKMLTLN
jgi:hypothetical protein